MQTKGWGNIPDKSTLNAQVKGDEDKFIAVGQVIIDGHASRSVSTAELVAGVSVPLRSPHRIVLEIDVVLTGTTTVQVSGSVRDPQGKAFGTPFSGQVAGKNGDHDRIQLTALTRL